MELDVDLMGQRVGQNIEAGIMAYSFDWFQGIFVVHITKLIFTHPRLCHNAANRNYEPRLNDLH